MGPEVSQIAAVILAGGRGRRMGGRDKGLVTIDGEPMIDRVISRLRPQVGEMLISANRSLNSYRRRGLPVIADSLGPYLGPLAGILSALDATRRPLLLSVPCDMPLLPSDLAERLHLGLMAADADASVACVGAQMHPVVCLLRRELIESLRAFLQGGGRKTGRWLQSLHLARVDFADQHRALVNLNSEHDLAMLAAAVDDS